MTPPVKKTAVAEPKKVAEAPKVEETKEVKVETPAPAPAEAKAEAKAEEKPASTIDFKDWSAYSLVLGGGLGMRDFGNDQGMDHKGGYFRLGAGLNFRFFDDRFKLTPRLVYEHQSLGKDLGQGITSDASIDMVGVEVDAGYAVHRDWFSIHGKFGLGAAIYSSPDTTDGLTGGAEFNKNALKAPLNGTALRVQPGIAVCTFNSSVCLDGTYAIDSGLNPKIDVVDGEFPPMGLSPHGFTIGGSVDVLGAVDFFVGKRRKKMVVEAAPKSDRTPAPEGDKKPDSKKDKTEGGGAKVEPKPKKVTGLALVEQGAKKIGEWTEEAKVNAQGAKVDADDFKKEKSADQKRVLATDAIFSFREAFKRQELIEKEIGSMEAEAAKLEGDDKKKAEALIAQAKKHLDTANTAARSAWDHAAATVKAYNKGKEGPEQLDFPDTKPADIGPAKAKGTGTKKKTDPKKDDKKADPKKDDKKADPKKDDKKADPKKDDKKADPKKDDKKSGGGIVFEDE